MKLRRHLCTAILGGVSIVLVGVSTPHAAIYEQGFESDTAGFFNTNRVSSGTGGITSASGSFHGTIGTGHTDWGGYDQTNGGPGNPFVPYITSLDIYLDVGIGAAHDTRFDFSSAINTKAGIHRRDFVFNGGFYSDDGAPGTGNRYVFSASNDGSGWPGNPARDPFVIDDTGWYTFVHEFADNAGVLAVTLSILDAADNLLHSWVLSDPSDLTAGENVGGNRYGWFVRNGLGTLAIDNAQLSIAPVPLPAALPLFIAGLAGMGLLGRRRKRGVVAIV